MAELTFTVDLNIPTIQGMERDILQEFSKHISQGMNQVLTIIPSKVEKIISDALSSSSTIQSLQGGDLSTLLCLDNPSSSVNQIQQAIIDSININKKPITIGSSYLTGGFSIEILDDSYRDIIGLNSTSYTTINGKFVPWLEWLLFYGNSPVMIKGRLLKTDKGVVAIKDKEDLSIPNSYAGDQADNFLTKALSPTESDIGNMIEQEISRRL